MSEKKALLVSSFLSICGTHFLFEKRRFSIFQKIFLQLFKYTQQHKITKKSLKTNEMTQGSFGMILSLRKPSLDCKALCKVKLFKLTKKIGLFSLFWELALPFLLRIDIYFLYVEFVELQLQHKIIFLGLALLEVIKDLFFL